MHRLPFPRPIWPRPAGRRPPAPAGGSPPAAQNAAGGATGPYRRIVPRARHIVAPGPTSQRFDGQLPGEHVIWIKRRSPLYLIATAWPMLVAVVLLVLLSVLGSTIVPLVPLQVIGILAFVGSAAWWIITAGWPWYFEYYILSNQRIIKTRGYPQIQRQEIALKSISQVRVECHNPIEVLLDLGDVEVRPIGDSITLVGVRHPRDVGDSILDAADGPPKSKGEAPPPKVANPKLQMALDRLAQPKPPPPTSSMGRPRFGGFLQRKIPIRMIEDEALVELVYRHWFILLRNELPTIGMIAGGIAGWVVLGGASPAIATLALAAGVLGGLAVGFFVYLNWADDVFILTTHRVIDIDRLFFILSEYSNDAPYARIQHVQVERSFLGYLLGYGSITVQTSGRKGPLHMSDIPHAYEVMDRIFEQIHLVREREAVAATNRQKKENYLWLSNILNEMLIQVPDFRGLPLLDAIALGHRAGLRVVVSAERPVPHVPAGRVLAQAPMPGSSAVANSEVQVNVSGNGVLARP